MKTGFIGLGHLGKAMAKRLMSEGVELIVWNRTKEKAADLGAEIAGSPSAAAAKADVVFLNLFDSAAVRAVLTEKGGLLEADCKGKIVIDTTTNHFRDVLSFHEMLRERGGSYLESPVLGSVVPAARGNLTVLVSGESSAYEKAKPLLEKIGNHIFYLEKPSLAIKMKLINNLTLGAFMAALAETVAFGEKAGIDKAQVLDILSAGAGNSLVLTAKKEKLLKEDFSTHFSCSLIYKDLHFLQDLAGSLKMPLFTGSIAKELFGMTMARGMEGLDFSAVYKVMKEY
ncbi:MAG: NAD(P)-dependent oxidoreductase [Nitrospiraceae bacterium]|nr:NAD(P)-dependent oxidoreductase [Nitrospiraceae bacterium]